MGPQLDSCGRPEPLAHLFGLLALQWGRNLTVAEGAAARADRALADALQWGRNLTVAEGRRPAESRNKDFIGLQWGRNLTVAEGVVRLLAGQ